MEYFLSSLIGYMLGSIPTAFLVLKKSKGIDITNVGSGNVGAMNSYEVTNSKYIGLLVFAIDFIKGILPVLFTRLIFNEVFIYSALALLFAIFSHCFNPWINFKGGRGLATAAGGSIFLFPYLLFVWIILWILVYVLKKDILIANIFATVLSLLLIFLTERLAINYVFPAPASSGELMLLSAGGLLIIFIKHIEPLKEIISKKREVKNDNT
ncbi:MAG TPA: glycerol-3-phosphate acyltransferase [Ignavibacteriaceae bacterium]|nr:glycerol-3-phosphate acyltransferase [Ignavibacteriaceae bacterium]